MVRYVVQEAVSPLQVYSRLRLITREFLLSQVPEAMQAPRKVGGRMDPQADMKGAAPKPSVCRRLFPEDEPDGMMDNMFNKITEEINRKLDEACNKYNFDFRSEVPLEGDWKWKRLSPEGEDDATEWVEPPATEVEVPEGSTVTSQPPTASSDTQAPSTVPQ
ncbi:uncharacterized protein LOC128988045 [Macrosteles quadrilineatus]|uniref:uncharacterized protein LOC128988045 n=1 Tax=Macrosteles quadrilineatus TaxID=74068 RepID=UPI0023E2C077|nr:uncharacterized protein LOC128988045 [Macrosteles quadrilineatus]